jgi:3-phenylpropionate/trans-cinnamate dioxygenase ferredoxin subunit
VTTIIVPAREIPQGEARRFAAGTREVAVANLGGGEFHAVDAICSHAHAYLDEGGVDAEERTIECPRHGSTFDLATGRALTLPATAPVQVFPVTVRDDELHIEVSDD